MTDKSYADLQAAIPTIHANKENPYFKSKYADLQTILDVALPIVAEYGFELRWSLGKVLTLDLVKDGERITSAMWPISEEVFSNPQAAGSVLTYARRYLLQVVLNLKITGEDDDANATTEKPKKPARKAPKKATDAQTQALMGMAKEYFLNETAARYFIETKISKPIAEISSVGADQWIKYFRENTDPDLWKEDAKQLLEEANAVSLSQSHNAF